jgi:hypothetical protein
MDHSSLSATFRHAIQTVTGAGFLVGTVFSNIPADGSEGQIPAFNARTQAAKRPIDLAIGPQLFVDDFLIHKSAGVRKTMHPPKRYEGNPVLGWREHTTQPYLTVLRDAATDRFRMWYNYDSGSTGAVAYAESADGIHWELPDLGILGNDNRLFIISHPHQTGYGSGIIDSGEDYAIPERRYKAAWWGQATAYPENGRTPARGGPGMYIAFSPDGIHWTKYEGNPVLLDFHEEWFRGDPRRPQGTGDIIDVFWDGLRHRYGAFLKTPAVPEDGYSMAPKARNYIRRLVSFSSSGDFIQWETPRRVVMPEPRDEGLLEFYGVGATIRRGNLLIGFVRMLHDDYPADEGGPADGIGYTTLVTSRDALHWERHGDTFFDREPSPSAWDHAMAWIGSLVAVDNQFYIYYGGYQRGHKSDRNKERQLGLAVMPKDRFVSVDSLPAQTGHLRTPGLYFVGLTRPRLVLNAKVNAGGAIRVRARDHNGNILPGVDFDDCRPLAGDGQALPVTWNASDHLGSLRDRVFHLEFELRDASLFGFDVQGP